MHSFEVNGGKKLFGEIIPQGAKNEALQIISAVILTPEKVTISNIPAILDVNLLIELLVEMKVKVDRPKVDVGVFQADDVDIDYLHSETFRKKSGRLRGSVMLAGPMLARFRKAFIPKPGGDKIGRRRLDTHIVNFERLGASFHFHPEDGFFHLVAPNLKGGFLLMDEPSVTGTANLIMASVMAIGKTTIYNAACEPYVQQLCRMLNRMGAKIEGIGSNLLIIEGVNYLGGTEHTMLPDMIEVGSFIGLAAMTQGDITIKNAGLDHIGIIPEKFQQLGIQMNFVGDDLHIPSQDLYEIHHYLDGGVLTIYDHPWPGFTPDLLSIVLVTATQARGSVLIHQKMFESRLFFVDKLIDMAPALFSA